MIYGLPDYRYCCERLPNHDRQVIGRFPAGNISMPLSLNPRLALLLFEIWLEEDVIYC